MHKDVNKYNRKTFKIIYYICLQTEYYQLADNLSDYVVKLLDRVRTHDELEMVLNKAGKGGTECFSRLARFKLALRYGEKKVNQDSHVMGSIFGPSVSVPGVYCL